MITTSGRLFIRYRQFGRFQADDVFNGLALLAFISYTTIDQLYMYSNSIDEAFLLKLQLATNMLLWATLYLVKASFLALIWTIFKISARFKTAWWIVAVYTFSSFWPVFLSELWQCGNPSAYDSAQSCNVDGVYQDQLSLVYIRLALHISSDCFIFILPLIHIQKLHMPLGRRISAAAVFGLIAVDIMVGIARNVVVICGILEGSASLPYSINVIGGVIEPTIAVIACSLPAYKVLVFKFRSRRSDGGAVQHNAAGMRGRFWLPRKLHLLTASIPSPYLEITILKEPTTQITDRNGEGILVEAPEEVHVLKGEGDSMGQ